MSARHTRGPWLYTQIGEACRFGPQLTIRAGLRVVCEVSRHDDTDTGAANAFLIAAAPDLLEALRALEEEAVACCAGAGFVGRPLDRSLYPLSMYNALRMARAAIAKAVP